MFDEPTEDPSERSFDPAARAKEKSDEFRMHSELAAVYEGPRKFDAHLVPGLSAEHARDIQRGISRLEKGRVAETPILPQESTNEAIRLLTLNESLQLSTNDYHIHRRPGEVMMVRWLVGDQVESFYTRIQAHFNAALEGYREDERQAQGWKQDPQTLAYLEALDAVDLKMADRYLRDTIREHKLFVLSTQTADEMNIAYITDLIMGIPAGEVVGSASAPPENPTDSDLSWFFKLFAIRGIVEDIERMCFFTYLQKSDDSF